MQKTVTVYSDTASGTYAVQACADSTKSVTETIENNNCGFAVGALTVQGATVSHSDLVVTAVTDPAGQRAPQCQLPARRHREEPGPGPGARRPRRASTW